MRARRWLVVALVIIALVLLVGRALASVYVGYRWFDALGAASLWRVETLMVLALRVLSALIAALFAFVNLYVVRRSVVSLVLPRRVANLEIGEEVPGRYLVGAAALLALMLAAFLTLGRDSWMSLFLTHSGVPFGDLDPYFSTDIGYFVYWLPFESALFRWALKTVFVTTTVVIILYALTPSVEWKRGSLYVSHYVRRHLAILAAVLLLMFAWNYRLDALTALLSGSGPNGTFTYTDLHASIQVSVVLSIFALATALVVAVFGWVGQVRVAFSAIALLFVLGIGLRQVVPPLVRRSALTPGPDTLDVPYQQMQAEYARRAYGIDRVRRADSSLTFVSLRAAAPAVSAWDPGALAQSVSRLHSDGIVMGTGWTSSADGLVAMLPQRPIMSGVVNDALEPWSMTRVRAWTADPDGDPVVAGPGTTSGSRELDGVIVSDSTDGYLLVADPFSRIAAPALTSGISRLAHAWALQNFGLLFGTLPGPLPRIVAHRDVSARVAALAPFFEQGSATVPVVVGDTLYWTIDLYAISSTFPLSEHVSVDDEDITYLHHAAMAVVNAQSGRVALVADSAPGPIARSWIRAFPSLFTTWAELPHAVAAELAPPADEARTQATVIARIGVSGLRPHRGSVPWNQGADTVLATEDVPVFALPGRVTRIAWGSPVLDDNEHVTGVLLATGGAQRATYWLPIDTATTVRWPTVLDGLRHALDSTANIPRDAHGVRGQIRAIPIGDDVAFVQPIYAWKGQGPPTLARIAILSSDSLMTGSTMVDATSPPGPIIAATDTAGGVSIHDFRARVASLYAAMRTALQHGDWAAFGRAYDALGVLLAKPPR
ncbi:MAG TPA: UPF0182 family protein [Gemmatimonadaceae bacterium]|nr:UPF0182 family protein [Gemmatimonadaceae bacterium]